MMEDVFSAEPLALRGFHTEKETVYFSPIDKIK